MEFKPTTLPEVILISPVVYGDERGFFMETYREIEFSAAGIPGNFVQDNHSGSVQGTLRGLHYQIKQSQGKLVQVVSGDVFDVAVDLRKSSPNFYVLSDWANVIYKVTDYYAPEWDRTLLWNDPEIGIDWPLIDGGKVNISTKDAKGLHLREAETFV